MTGTGGRYGTVKERCQRGRNPRGDASEDEKPVVGDYYAGRLDKILSRMGGRKMSRHKTDPIVMERVLQVIYDTGMSNKRLAQALGLNVNTISSWINGRTEISVEGIRRLCQYTHTNPAWVLGLSERRGL